MTSALATRVLVGVQPVLTQVPPNRWRSTMATLMPAVVRRSTSEGPAWPAPTTMASKVLFTAESLLRELRLYDKNHVRDCSTRRWLGLSRQRHLFGTLSQPRCGPKGCGA